MQPAFEILEERGYVISLPHPLKVGGLSGNYRKNDTGRAFPFRVLPDDMLMRWERTMALQRATGRLIGPVFHSEWEAD